MTSQTGQQVIAIHIYLIPNSSRTKGNQSMKFDQLIKYSLRNIALQNPCRKWVRVTSSKSHFFFFLISIWGKSK